MSEVVGCCGLLCSGCGAFIAFRDNDQAVRERTAAEWSIEYNCAFSPDAINCVGCSVEGEPHIGHCFECDIRLCAVDKGLSNCSECDDFACARLQDFASHVPGVMERLLALRG